MNEVRLTLKQIKKLDQWPKLKNVLDGVVEDFKKVYPNDNVELVETKYSVQFVVNGIPEYEMDAVDMVKTAKANKYN